MSLKYFDKSVYEIILYTNILKRVEEFKEFLEKSNNKKIDLSDLSELALFKMILVGYVNLLKYDYERNYASILESIIQSIDNIINHFSRENE